MKILIVRHGDPNYATDSLTEKGQREAEILSKRLCKENVKAFYCSPLGRAKLTVKPTLDALGREAEILPWLKEFSCDITLPYHEHAQICWDILPEFMNALSNIYHPTLWLTEKFIKESTIAKDYENVCKELDLLIARHGYEREGYNYRAVTPNHDTIVLVCHFGLTGILLSHLMNCSPYSVWQHTCTAPTAVTTLYTEERVDGKALFRAASIGDISHLYEAGENPAFAGRFCECFTDDTRH